ncbi:hypothetical protein N7539_004078 [Penicillium diatomitis]|uniref:Uncharacterized protein n=1 Tax=Penicillium diatomitis TaxID=2819901 RepID=A0A9W9XE43_9EURO|nr:uncharacterized protein N7539_004078 [Penicillium diatomitis]KAJ5489188.1 hypothetical protein N7539_004078 [Penicillium diatomitis]
MTMNMFEPSAIKVKDMRDPGSTSIELHVKVETAEGTDLPEISDERLPRGQQGLTFSIESILRLKTFYSLSPFPTVPGQKFSQKRVQYVLKMR